MRAKEKNPRNIKLYLHVAEAYHMAGYHEKARTEVARALELIRDKTTFEKVLNGLREKGGSGLGPSAAVLVPMIRDACLNQSETLKQWSELLPEEDSEWAGKAKTEGKTGEGMKTTGGDER
jgi:hypothetical protein